jgi:hypothetical protein
VHAAKQAHLLGSRRSRGCRHQEHSGWRRDSAGVIQQVTHGDRGRRAAIPDAERWQVLLHGRVELDPSRVDELHHRERRK